MGRVFWLIWEDSLDMVMSMGLKVIAVMVVMLTEELIRS
jgi:hypothetical protein